MSDESEKAHLLFPINDPMYVQLLSDHAHLIKCVAQKIASKLPSSVEFDDLFSAGVIGLMDAVQKYNPERDNKFKTYAEFRIRGAILDELRSQDWLPRSVRELKRKEDNAKLQLEKALGRPASEMEIAKKLDISLSDYQEQSGKIRVSLVSFSNSVSSENDKHKISLDQLEDTKIQNPFVILNGKNEQDVIAKSVKELPEKQRTVLQLYYYDDLNLKEIGHILGITESRVSQIHSAGIKKMKIRLKHLLNED